MNNKKTSKKAGGRGASSNKKSENDAPASGSPMDVRVLEQIVKLMSANDLNTIEVRDGERRVILKRGADVVTHAGGGGFYATPQSAQPTQASNAGTSGAASTPPTPAVSDEANYPTIKSPMVGTFYSASSPEAKPFVSVGTTVDEETDVCVIEAMKVFNNIKAETRGTIVKILVTNGQTVEFGQPLFVVKP